MKTLLGVIAAGAISLIAGNAFAQSQGAVKVECWGYCQDVALGEICDTYSLYSEPVSVACDDTAEQGAGINTACGYATCRPYGTLIRSDRLSDYCDDGGGFDAVVTCRASYLDAQPAQGKQDDRAQQ